MPYLDEYDGRDTGLIGLAIVMAVLLLVVAVVAAVGYVR